MLRRRGGRLQELGLSAEEIKTFQYLRGRVQSNLRSRLGDDAEADRFFDANFSTPDDVRRNSFRFFRLSGRHGPGIVTRSGELARALGMSEEGIQRFRSSALYQQYDGSRPRRRLHNLRKPGSPTIRSGRRSRVSRRRAVRQIGVGLAEVLSSQVGGIRVALKN